MSVRLDDAEIVACLAESHTGVLSTLRADGSPAMMPLWFVMVDGEVCLRTLATSAKVRHIREDPRVSFLVEHGRAWAELKAVVLYGDATLVQDERTIVEIDEAFTTKYAGFGLPPDAPSRTREHYARGRAHICITPTRRPMTWDNAKLLR